MTNEFHCTPNNTYPRARCTSPKAGLQPKCAAAVQSHQCVGLWKPQRCNVITPTTRHNSGSRRRTTGGHCASQVRRGAKAQVRACGRRLGQAAPVAWDELEKTERVSRSCEEANCLAIHCSCMWAQGALAPAAVNWAVIVAWHVESRCNGVLHHVPHLLH